MYRMYAVPNGSETMELEVCCFLDIDSDTQAVTRLTITLSPEITNT